MSEPTDRFAIEIGTGTVAHIIDMNADQAETNSRFSLGLSSPGEKMCSRGNRHPGDKRVPFAEFVSTHDLDKAGFEGDAPDQLCSYCWSNTREAVETEQDSDDLAEKIGTLGYRLRWKQKGRVRDFTLAGCRQVQRLDTSNDCSIRDDVRVFG